MWRCTAVISVLMSVTAHEDLLSTQLEKDGECSEGGKCGLVAIQMKASAMESANSGAVDDKEAMQADEVLEAYGDGDLEGDANEEDSYEAEELQGLGGNMQWGSAYKYARSSVNSATSMGSSAMRGATSSVSSVSSWTSGKVKRYAKTLIQSTCKQVVRGIRSKRMCARAAAKAGVICQAAGFGPENPGADVCAGAFSISAYAGCNAAFKRAKSWASGQCYSYVSRYINQAYRKVKGNLGLPR